MVPANQGDIWAYHDSPYCLAAPRVNAKWLWLPGMFSHTSTPMTRWDPQRAP